MEQIADDICHILHDYHYFTGFKFTQAHVLNWIGQFEKDDQLFILEEFLHLLNQKIYFSEEDVRQILVKKIKVLAQLFKFKNEHSFLSNCLFLKMQSKEKSQNVLLKLLDEEIIKHFGLSLMDCGTESNKYVIYFDDILATGGTVFNHSVEWLSKIESGSESANYLKVINGEQIFIISVICAHYWGAEKIRWRIKYKFSSDQLRSKMQIRSTYTIQNHPSEPGQRFNFAYPIREEQPQFVIDYLNGLDAEYDEQFAFRNIKTPTEETFYRSSKNRIRFENIFLQKGIELLNKAQNKKSNHRPLGMTNPTKKTFGTGTLFFTWRNISNTTPIAFWWESANWHPLFPLLNRGD